MALSLTPLNLTKVAFGCSEVETLRERIAWRAAQGPEFPMTTRYMPKRAAEMAGGSLYWILANQIIGRSPLLGFAVKPDGKHWIRLAPTLIAVVPRTKRAHQGWRYLADEDSPADLDGENEGDLMPGRMAAELSKLGLL